LAALVLLLSTAPASAVDGVIEINQARALAGGVTAGDTAGYPVTISEAGSYRLTGNLSVGSSAHGIHITAADVSVDLNGFRMYGSGGSSNRGFHIEADNVELRNGTISEFGSALYVSPIGTPLRPTFGLRLIHLKAVNNNSAGFDAGQADGAQVLNCHVSYNGGVGISVGPHSLITGNTSMENSGVGISSDTSLIKNNTVEQNGSFGIYCYDTCTIIGNLSRSNTGAGIMAYQSSVILDNAVRSNTGYGLDLGPTTGYARNSINDNTGGTVDDGIQVGTNICDGNTTCP
jgi:hypothetical protein